jgi:hypothetical protein
MTTEPIDLIAELQLDSWRGSNNISLLVRDFRAAEPISAA